MQVDADVIVVGGGISGLASAWALQQGGAQVVLLEAAPRAGGTIGSAREDGFLVESGPNSVLDTTPHNAKTMMLELIRVPTYADGDSR